MRNRGRTVTRAQLLDALWDQSGRFVNDNTLTVTMKRLLYVYLFRLPKNCPQLWLPHGGG